MLIILQKLISAPKLPISLFLNKNTKTSYRDYYFFLLTNFGIFSRIPSLISEVPL